MVGNLVSVHAWRRNFDRSFPVVVHMAEFICKLVKNFLRNVAVILSDKIVYRINTSLSNILAGNKKVVGVTKFLLCLVDNIFADDSSTVWIFKLIALNIEIDKSMIDAFIDNNKSDLRHFKC